jgi:thiol-disulfide isomerase/thioredoxin
MVEDSPSPIKRRYTVVAAGGIAGLVIGLAAVYGISLLQGNPAGDSACNAALETAHRLAPLAQGEVAAVAVATKPLAVPNLAFADAGSTRRHLSDWRGRSVLLNLWATWCIPCRKEMPALDELQGRLGGPQFEVVAINIDTRDPDKPRNWLKEIGIKRLGYYADREAKVFQDLKIAGRAIGMPTTMLIDSTGCELGTLAGPAEWASDDAIKLVSAALRR